MFTIDLSGRKNDTDKDKQIDNEDFNRQKKQVEDKELVKTLHAKLQLRKKKK